MVHRRKLRRVCDRFGGQASGGFSGVGFAGYVAAEWVCSPVAPAFGSDGDQRGLRRGGTLRLRAVRQGGQENLPGDRFPPERVVWFKALGPEGPLDGKASGILPLRNVARRWPRSFRQVRCCAWMGWCAGGLPIRWAGCTPPIVQWTMHLRCPLASATAACRSAMIPPFMALSPRR